jgi:ketosteroid isomerase-like protein
MKLTCRWVVSARIASSSWLNRRAVRQRRSSVGNRDIATILAHSGPRRHSLPGVAVKPGAPDDAAMTDTTTIIDQFNAAFLQRAPEKLVDLIAADCVMEGTGPAPDGARWTGYDECLAGWQGLASDPAIQFAVEHVDVDGDRAVIRWRITGTEDYRGVNLMRVRDGKITEALGYGKRP